MCGVESVTALEAWAAGVSRETLASVGAYLETLTKWQKAINLVGPATLADAWTRHVVDSAQIAPLIPAGAKSLADLGTGAGLPGLVLAAVKPDLDVTLVESDARKAAFLGEASRRMALKKQPRILVGRIEAVPPVGADVVTARALAPLKQLLIWADRHRSDTAICLFHKGKGWQGEVAEAKKDCDFPCQTFPSVTDRDAVLLRIGPTSSADLRDRQPEGRRR